MPASEQAPGPVPAHDAPVGQPPQYLPPSPPAHVAQPLPGNFHDATEVDITANQQKHPAKEAQKAKAGQKQQKQPKHEAQPPAAQPRRVSARANKGVPPIRFSKDFVLILCLLLLLPTAFGQEALVMKQLGAVAEKCGEVAITEETAHFPMILRLSMLDPKLSYNNCTSKAILDIEEQESRESVRPTWMSPDPGTEGTPLDLGESDDWAIMEKKQTLLAPFLQSYKCNYSLPKYTQFEVTMATGQPVVKLKAWKCLSPIVRRKRFAPLIALGILGIGAGIVRTGLGIYSAIEIVNLKQMHADVVSHINALQDEVRAEHDDLVKLEYLSNSLYEYTHSEFRQLANQVQKAVCYEAGNEQAILQILSAVKIKAKLYTDLSSAVSSVFSTRAGPIILQERTIVALMRARRDWFYNTVYWDEPTLVYQFGSVTPVHPYQTPSYRVHLTSPEDSKAITHVLVLYHESWVAKGDCPGQVEAAHECGVERWSTQAVYCNHCPILPVHGGLERKGRMPHECLDVLVYGKAADGHGMVADLLWLLTGQ